MTQTQSQLHTKTDIYIKIEGTTIVPKLEKLIESIITVSGRAISIHLTIKYTHDTDRTLWEINAIETIKASDPRDIIAEIEMPNQEHIIYLPFYRPQPEFDIIAVEINDLTEDEHNIVFNKVQEYLKKGKEAYIVVRGKVIGYYNELGEVYPDDEFNVDIKHKKVIYIGDTTKSITVLSENNIVIWIHDITYF